MSQKQYFEMILTPNYSTDLKTHGFNIKTLEKIIKNF